MGDHDSYSDRSGVGSNVEPGTLNLEHGSASDRHSALVVYSERECLS
jgi:hypothetical protein